MKRFKIIASLSMFLQLSTWAIPVDVYHCHGLEQNITVDIVANNSGLGSILIKNENDTIIKKNLTGMKPTHVGVDLITDSGFNRADIRFAISYGDTYHLIISEKAIKLECQESEREERTKFCETVTCTRNGKTFGRFEVPISYQCPQLGNVMCKV